MGLLNKTSVGLDISDATIEVVKLAKNGNKYSVESKSRILIKEGIVENGRIKNKLELVKAIKEAMVKAKPLPIKDGNINFAFPDSQIYIKIISIAEAKKSEKEELILKKILSTIPIKEDNLIYSFLEISPNKAQKIKDGEEKNTKYLIAAAKKSAVKEWQDFFKENKFSVKDFDIESIALFRGIYNEAPKNSVCVVDIGKRTTDIAIFDGKELVHEYTINIAGDYINKKIANSLKISIEEAEDKKKTANLSGVKSKLQKPIQESLDLIIAELKRTLDYFSQQSQLAVKEINLVGGTSKLKNIDEYFLKSFKESEIIIGQSFVLAGSELEYIEAAGLALRSIKNSRSRELSLPLFIEPKKKTISRKKIELESSSQVIENEQADDNQAVNSKTALQLKILIGLILAGIILLGMAYVYRKNQDEKKMKAIQNLINPIKISQTVDLKIMLSISPDEYSLEAVRARIIDFTLNENEIFETRIIETKSLASAQLMPTEELWPESVESLLIASGTPSIKWLAFSKQEVDKFFIDQLNEMNDKKIPFEIQSMSKTSLEKTKNPNVLYLNGQVAILSDQPIDFAQ